MWKAWADSWIVGNPEAYMVDKSALLTLSGIVVRRWSRGWDR